MVEGGADEATEADIIDALMFAHRDGAADHRADREAAQGRVGKPKRAFSVTKLDPAIQTAIAALVDGDLRDGLRHQGEEGALRRATASSRRRMVVDAQGRGSAPRSGRASRSSSRTSSRSASTHVVRKMVLEKGKRIDGRDARTIRPISCEVGLLPRVARLGAVPARRDPGDRHRHARHRDRRAEDRRADRRVVEALHAPLQLPALLAPARPSPCAAPAVARSATAPSPSAPLARMLPDHEKFPYTIRIVSEILESNGSSSMATVCGGDPVA